MTAMAAAHQLSLLCSGVPTVLPDAAVVRHDLDATSWVDIGRGWLSGGDDLYERCRRKLSWSQRRRPMYGALVLEPRLTAVVQADRPGVPDAVAQIADALSTRYAHPLRQVWANWYRDGSDAVAWHGDRVGRTEHQPLVAVISLGGPRRFALRPGPAHPDRRSTSPRRWDLHSGDLLVMGGDCQHRWEHTVPRRRGAAPRISLTFRARRPQADG
jgi:alkylated DNA repair dioxygenase AlkB